MLDPAGLLHPLLLQDKLQLTAHGASSEMLVCAPPVKAVSHIYIRFLDRRMRFAGLAVSTTQQRGLHFPASRSGGRGRFKKGEAHCGAACFTALVVSTSQQQGLHFQASQSGGRGRFKKGEAHRGGPVCAY
ncbi:hypothetical protein NDU88_007462 [Pleurodeles waltl]|uniref:Uncharacterized protein n=1 Tax=Pleurodeles waltl TaxID=8319 RepID=A0AAV7WHG1_PLEWA|nr:hypothetical protein NDU88_007462 [Pleurodeles waltl]